MAVNYETYFATYTVALYDCGNRLKRRNIRNLLPRLAGKRVLDIGAGSGDVRLDLILNCGANPDQYFSLDLARNSLQLAGMLSADHNLPFVGVQGDAQNLPFADEAFDVVVCSEVLEHLPKDEQAVREIRRVLRENGLALITVPSTHKPQLPEWGHLRTYSGTSFAELVKMAKLDLVNIIYQGRWHDLTWRWAKLGFGGAWRVMRRFARSDTRYHASWLHRRLAMPLFDRILYLDDAFAKRQSSILGSDATLVALIKKS